MSSLKELQDLIHEKYGIDMALLDPSSSIREKGMDSLALVELLFAIEDRFAITMPSAVAKIDTLGELAGAVDQLLAAKADAAAPSARAA
jgi:acyl carrier protein